MLKVHVKYHLKPGTRDAFLAGITEKTLQDAVLHEDGCLKYDYSPVADDPGPVHGPHGPGHGGGLTPPPKASCKPPPSLTRLGSVFLHKMV